MLTPEERAAQYEVDEKIKRLTSRCPEGGLTDEERAELPALEEQAAAWAAKEKEAGP